MCGLFFYAGIFAVLTIFFGFPIGTVFLLFSLLRLAILNKAFNVTIVHKHYQSE